MHPAWANKEDLEIDKDALKLIASTSDGCPWDAEKTLEELSLLGQRIFVRGAACRNWYILFLSGLHSIPS